MTIHYHRPADYARRPTAPRRRREPVARPAEQPGQVPISEIDRRKRNDLALRTPCPACHSPAGEPCTRPPGITERGRQPLRLTCHLERYAAAEPNPPRGESTP